MPGATRCDANSHQTITKKTDQRHPGRPVAPTKNKVTLIDSINRSVVRYLSPDKRGNRRREIVNGEHLVGAACRDLTWLTNRRYCAYRALAGISELAAERARAAGKHLIGTSGGFCRAVI